MELNNKEEESKYSKLNIKKEIFQEIVNEYRQLIAYTEEKILNSLNNFDNEINNSIKGEKTNESKESINNHFKEMIEGYINIYYNEHIKRIISLIKCLEDTIRFNPPNMDNFSSKLNESNTIFDSFCDKLYQSSFDYVEVINIINKNQNTISLLCNFCNKEKEAKYYCNHCNLYLCNECYEKDNIKIEDIEEETNHKFIIMNKRKRENEKKKQDFLKSFLYVMKKYILKCNYIIKNENQDYVDPDTYKKFDYPSIINEDNIDNQIDFLMDIDIVYNFIKKRIDTKKSINEEELCRSLLISFSDMFKGQIQLNQDNIDDDFFSDGHGEESEENCDEKCDENHTNNNENDKFYYVVNIINKENYMLEDNNYNKTILEKLAGALSTNKNNILLLTNNNSIFINNFIKSRLFAKLTPKDIRINFPNLKNLYDFKIIIDGLIRLKSGISVQYLDYRYNFIIPNLSLNNKRGSEIYNPPYGWAGIGLNVVNKYDNGDWLKKDNDSWAIAYYGFGKFSSSTEIGKMLNNIVVKGEFKRELSIRCNALDIRHNGRRVGVGIYLSPNVNIAERYCGIFSINLKKYKVVLMAKVLIDKIKEPEDHSFWILNENDIRIYKILVKEI